MTEPRGKRAAEREMHYVQANRDRVPTVGPDDPATIASLIDAQVAIRPDAVSLVTQDSQTTWREFQKLANRVSNLLLARGVAKGDAVALNMDNSVLFLACVVGISRIGAVVGLINTNLVGTPLIHCVGQIEARVSMVDGRALAAIAACADDYRKALPERAEVIHFGVSQTQAHDWFIDGDALLASASDDIPVCEPVLGRDWALYIFTSGTTGLPKATIITHQKFYYGAAGNAVFGLRARPHDRVYNCLPLYHGTGLMVGWGGCIFAGCSMFLRPKFSASALIREANEYHCNILVYIGELCRYLLSTPEDPLDRKTRITRAVGNGLRPDIWKPFKKRFGLRRITEFWGASEANGGFMNVFNKDETIGMTGATCRLVDYSTEDATAVRGADGFLKLVPPGEPGLLLFEVSPTSATSFDGYKNKEQSETKLIRDAFEKGDCWFNSGDLLKQVDVGFVFDIPHYQFVDRLGDTYRWKAENVSTNEVAEVLCQFDQIDVACVYGVAVPGTDGKAGMAAVALAADAGPLDLDRFAHYVEGTLAHYARPVFIRVSGGLELTGTHKLVKTRVVEEGFDPAKVTEPLFMLDPKTRRYVPVDAARFAEIMAGRSGY
ncbi:MAG: long-chain-acyl-CoA synthetase [Sphingomonas sp.]|nr:long-chain-acyl-CoA synthetase [Sphingomonas sp.]